MKPYIRRMPASWWLKQPSYLLFMLRELSCVFVGGYVVLFLMMIRSLAQGPDQYEAFLGMLRSPLAILFHVVALAFALLHTITWFQATPKAMAVWKGEERLPPAMMIIPNYVAWVVVSGVVAWVVLAG
jgi:succinate dehydrogenase subunit C